MAAACSNTRRNTRRNSRRNPVRAGSGKIRARTERMNAGVRLGFCLVALMLACAFLVAALPEYRKLQSAQVDLEEAQALEQEALDRVDAEERRLRAVIHDKEYLGIIARDRLDYYIPGETVIRIEK